MFEEWRSPIDEYQSTKWRSNFVHLKPLQGLGFNSQLLSKAFKL